MLRRLTSIPLSQNSSLKFTKSLLTTHRSSSSLNGQFKSSLNVVQLNNVISRQFFFKKKSEIPAEVKNETPKEEKEEKLSFIGNVREIVTDLFEEILGSIGRFAIVIILKILLIYYIVTNYWKDILKFFWEAIMTSDGKQDLEKSKK